MESWSKSAHDLQRQDDVEQPLRRDEGRARRQRPEQAARHAHARGVKIAHQIEPLFQHLVGVRADLLAAEAGGVGGGEHGADGRAGDDLGPQAELVEGFQHRNVGEPARAAAAERQADAGRSGASWAAGAGAGLTWTGFLVIGAAAVLRTRRQLRTERLSPFDDGTAHQQCSAFSRSTARQPMSRR